MVGKSQENEIHVKTFYGSDNSQEKEIALKPSKYIMTRVCFKLTVTCLVVLSVLRADHMEIFTRSKIRRVLGWIWKMSWSVFLYTFPITLAIMLSISSTDWWLSLATMFDGLFYLACRKFINLKDPLLRSILSRYDDPNIFPSSPKRWKGVWKLVLFITMFFVVIGMICEQLYFLSIGDFVYDLNKLVPGPSENRTELLIKAFPAFVWISHSVVIQGGTLAMLFLYMLLCYEIQEEVRATNKCLKKLSIDYDKTMVIEIHRKLLEIRKHAHAVETIFSKNTLFWHGFFIIGNCMLLTSYFLEKKSVWNGDFGKVCFVLEFTYPWLIVIVVTLGAARAAEEVALILPNLCDILNEDNKQDLDILFNHSHAMQNMFTAWNVFTITKSSLFSLLGITLSYAIIMVQFNPRAMTEVQASVIQLTP